MKTTPYPFIYRLFHSFQVVVHSFNLYAGAPSEPFLLVVHSKRVMLSNLCTSCTKVLLSPLRNHQQNRGFDLYRIVASAECQGMKMRCLRHPSYQLHSETGGMASPPHVLNSVVHNVVGIKQVYKQMKTSIEELKNVIDLDVRGNKDNHRFDIQGAFSGRLYGHAEEGIEMTAVPKEKNSHKNEEKPSTSESDIVDAEWVEEARVKNRRVVITVMMDVPGMITTHNNQTHPQFDVHIAVEGNNTYVPSFLPHHP